MNKVKRYINSTKSNKRAKIQFDIPNDLLTHVFDSFSSPQEIYNSSIVCKKWNLISLDKIRNFVTNMQWSVYMMSSKLAIAVLGKCMLDFDETSSKYSGLGGITSYMIWESLKGKDVTFELPFHNENCLHSQCRCFKTIPPSLVLRSNNSICTLISLTPNTVYSVMSQFHKIDYIDSLDSTFDDDLGDYNLNIYNTSYSEDGICSENY